MKKIRFYTSLLSLLLLTQISCAQIPEERAHCQNPAFDKKVSQTIDFSVPTIGVPELEKIQNEVYIFDTREKVEYNLSHIPNAKYLGYNDFDSERLKNISKDSKIILYCSIGYRSEKIGEKLIKLGYTNVLNLYGSIFEWVNQGNQLFDINGNTTHKIHTYNRNWSKWVDEGKAEKIW